MADRLTRDLFDATASAAGSLACGIEIAATMADALARAQERGIRRAEVAERMSYYLGERMSEAMLNAYTATSKDRHEVSLRRSMAFDAALESDVLLNLYGAKRGGRRVITAQEAAYIDLGRIHQQKAELARQEKALKHYLEGQK